MWRYTILTLVLVHALAGGSAAQESPPQPVEGDLIRVQTTALRGVYQVVDWTAPNLAVRDRKTHELMPIPVESIRRIEIRTGVEPRERSFRRGVGIGFLVGAATGAIIGLASGDDPGGLISFTAEEKALGAGFILGVIGAGVGGMVGLSSPGSRWDRISPPAQLAAVRYPAGSWREVEGGEQTLLAGPAGGFIRR